MRLYCLNEKKRVAIVPVLKIMDGRLKGAIFIHDMNVFFGDRFANLSNRISKTSTLAKLIVKALMIIDSSLTQSVIKH